MPEREETETRPRKWGRTFTKRGSGVFQLAQPVLGLITATRSKEKHGICPGRASWVFFFVFLFCFVLFVKKGNQLRNCLHFADVETEAQRVSPGHPTSPGQEEAWRVLGLQWGT